MIHPWRLPSPVATNRNCGKVYSRANEGAADGNLPLINELERVNSQGHRWDFPLDHKPKVQLE